MPSALIRPEATGELVLTWSTKRTAAVAAAALALVLASSSALPTASAGDDLPAPLRVANRSAGKAPPLTSGPGTDSVGRRDEAALLPSASTAGTASAPRIVPPAPPTSERAAKGTPSSPLTAGMPTAVAAQLEQSVSTARQQAAVDKKTPPKGYVAPPLRRPQGVKAYWTRARDPRSLLRTSQSASATGKGSRIPGKAATAGAPTGTLSGVVSDSSSKAPIPGACVTAYSQSDDGQFGPVCTGSDGRYTMSVPADDVYYLIADDPVSAHQSKSVEGETVSTGAVLVVDWALDPGVAVAGTVTGPDGNPVQDICVSLLDATLRNWEGAGGCTDAAGRYQTTGAPPGSHLVYFMDDKGPLLAEYYDNAADGSQAKMLTLSAGQIQQGVSAQLARGGTVTATVTGDDTGAPVPGACMNVFDSSDGEGSYRCADSQGAVTSGGLPTGTYVVEFWDQNSRYLPEYYDDQKDFAKATPVALTVGENAALRPVSLALGGSITGRVTAADTGAGLPGACVRASSVDVAVNNYGFACADADGVYTLGGLRTGSVTVSFSSTGDYLEQYYNRTDYANATPVQVTTSQQTTGINGVLELGGSISGRVTVSGSDTPLPGACVSLMSRGGGAGGACSDAQGRYTIHAVPPGQYAVSFYKNRYVQQFWQGASDYQSATLVPVATSQAVTGIDAAMQLGGTISGTITDAATGAPVDGCSVWAIAASTGKFAQGACSYSNGAYAIDGLAAGSYRVQFQISGYLNQWYRAAASEAEAQPVTVASGEVTSGVDAAVAKGRTLSGRLTTSNNAPVPAGTCVSVTPLTSGQWPRTSCDIAPDGSYNVAGLPSGDVKVGFTPSYRSGYQAGWYRGRNDFATADVVKVGATDVTGIDDVLRRGGSIGGTMKTPDGTPATTGCADAYLASATSMPVAEGCADSTGAYTIEGLSAGSYLVRFKDTSGASAPLWAEGKPDASSADAIVLASSEQRTGVDATFQKGARLSGVVTSKTDGSPISGVCLSASGPGLSGEKIGCTDGSGRYTSVALGTGTYSLSFTPPDSGAPFLPLRSGSGFGSGPTSVDTVAGVDKAGVDARLELGASVTGSVRPDSGSANGFGAALYDVTQESANFWSPAASTYAYGGGAYKLVAPAGSYKLSFSAYNAPYQPEWWNDKPDAASADVITLAAGDQKSGIDAVLTRVTTGTVSGTVVDDGTSQAIAGVCLQLTSGGNGPSYYSTCTDDQGKYSTAVLPGSYTARFYSSYRPEYFEFSPAGSVVVTAGQTIILDARLKRGASISGVIRDAGSGALLPNICAEVSDGSRTYGSRCTQSDGVFTTGALPPGNYKLLLSNYSGRFIPQWFDGKATSADAQVFSLADQQQVTGVTVAMRLGGTLTGKVTRPDGSPLAGICVEVLAPDGGFGGYGSCTGTDGVYRTPGLSAGSYVLRFSDPNGAYVTQYYDGGKDLASARQVAVTSGQDTTANAVLAPAAKPSARRIADYDGDGKADVAVFRPNSDGAGNARWFIARSSGGTDEPFWGSSTDKPVPGDYDGDGRTDVAVFRPDADGQGNARWFIRRSSDGAVVDAFWGNKDDRPVVGDFDGDGKDDLGVFRPSTGQWLVSLSGGGTLTQSWGAAGDVPLAADFDGDGRTDIGVYRPNADGRGSGRWFVRRSADGSTLDTWWGAATDTPVAADFDGDGLADVAVERADADGSGASRWFVQQSNGGVSAPFWGSSGDVLVPADYDGDGKVDVAVVRPGGVFQWWISGSAGAVSSPFWGGGSDRPLGGRSI